MHCGDTKKGIWNLKAYIPSSSMAVPFLSLESCRILLVKIAQLNSSICRKQLFIIKQFSIFPLFFFWIYFCFLGWLKPEKEYITEISKGNYTILLHFHRTLSPSKASNSIIFQLLHDNSHPTSSIMQPPMNQQPKLPSAPPYSLHCLLSSLWWSSSGLIYA